MSRFGYSVGTAGDANDDGYDDVIVGAPHYDNGEKNEGRAYVYYGASDYVTVTRSITYTYDPLGRLTDADYSTGEGYAYAYDAVGNRTAMTGTTPLNGTLVTTYTYNVANYLTARSVSDGRVYTYTWSQRGQLLAENTLGVDVRTFAYDGAGRLVEATVFTLTTRFTYNGLGARVAVEVVGQGTTTVTLDYAGGNRILAEATITDTVQYLYGQDCLGEYRDDEWLYYLNDGSGLVRQGTDDQGNVESVWLFDPDGTVLEGPEGPVSHLVCGGVYDWSTGLIYKGGRYFDPLLGIWLAALPLIVIQCWRGRRKKGWRGWPWYAAVALFLVGTGGVLVGCEEPPAPWSELACLEVTPLSPPLGKRALMVGPGSGGGKLPSEQNMQTWTKARKQDIDLALNAVMRDKFGGSDGFGDLEVALAKFRVSEARPILLVQSPNYNPEVPAMTRLLSNGNAYVNIYDSWFNEPEREPLLGHEMAHYWNFAHDGALDQEMIGWINWGVAATWYGGDKGDDDDFAEAVTVYFWPNYREGRERAWTDDKWLGLSAYWWTDGPDQLKLDERGWPHPDGTIQVCDRYDYLEYLFTGERLEECPASS